ncbi:acyl-CoA-binding domain-containing protein 1-like [Dorcoceras hygrometricum]|uniref:Acyl-CoA-binding domain-containing protein 1-like n=1 Tax=Dorcoceras hygrometricum TaxID=472368 RepID=A0A2Z7AWY1_9LAMI|nr:acyl-CoA-binding domain-containing protein 1-like [Dorcoceras hygrometricum]
MADWQQYLQSVFFGVIFSFLLAKLFSVIFAFRDENLRITRSSPVVSEPDPRVCDETEPLIDENVKSGDESVAVTGDRSESDDDDWEGVESTELDETFSAATAFVAATAVDRAALKVSNDVQLQLYGLYKIATEGPCSAPQPSALKMTARAKWQAWHKLGAMPPEEAMEKYIAIVTELYPSWAAGSAKKKVTESSDAPNAGSKGPMGPVFSSFIYEEEPGCDLGLFSVVYVFCRYYLMSPGVHTLKISPSSSFHILMDNRGGKEDRKMDAIHSFAQEGDEENLLKCIESGVPLNLKDSEGRTPLHWAVDRGHVKVTALLLNKTADVNTKDNEGQTALHYAALCDRASIAELLMKHGADLEIKDNEGNTATDLCESNWPWMHHVNS